ncbi:PmbA/TldA family metallopeptidase [Wolbachia endosymbiont of Atemnus politus]|uniref:PmbA/TldA family metallopeptidase n=1 Tax=Wolbachia endosymbiont of Atemnus politus TaxID=2682840 RepID=UPI00397CFB80
MSQSKNSTIGIRAIAGKTKAAYVSTNDLNNLGDTVSQVTEMTKNAPEDPYINFAVGGDNYTSIIPYHTCFQFNFFRRFRWSLNLYFLILYIPLTSNIQ